MIGPLGEKRTSYTPSRPRYRWPDMVVRGVQWSILATAILLGFVIVYGSLTVLDADVGDTITPPVAIETPPPLVAAVPQPPPVVVMKKPTDLECRFVWVGGCKYLRCTGPTMNLVEPDCVPKDATVKEKP